MMMMMMMISVWTHLQRQGDNDESLNDNGDRYPGGDQLGTVSQVVAQLTRQVIRVHEFQRQPTQAIVVKSQRRCVRQLSTRCGGGYRQGLMGLTSLKMT